MISLQKNVFRASVGAVIINNSGEVLALERSGIKDAWQMPQGGIEGDEDPVEAVIRELWEETGLDASDVELLEEYPEWLAYELPAEMRRTKFGRGQVQKWFLFRLVSSETSIQLDRTSPPEFASWKWMTLTELAKVTVPFRQTIYTHLVSGFAAYLAP
jgi:putative (di)nucleoside polyphosphate hydrolase